VNCKKKGKRWWERTPLPTKKADKRIAKEIEISMREKENENRKNMGGQGKERMTLVQSRRSNHGGRFEKEYFCAQVVVAWSTTMLHD
jgi:hypothetical protein